MPEGGVGGSTPGVCPVMWQSPRAEAWALGHHSPGSPASNQTGLEAQAGFFFMLRTLTICGGYKQWVPQVCAFSSMYSLFFFFWPHWAACEILVPRLVIEPASPALEARNLNYWTPREVPYSLLFSEHIFSEARRNEQISLLYLKTCMAKINKKEIKNNNLWELKKGKKE